MEDGRREVSDPLGDFLTLHSAAQLGGKFNVLDIYGANFSSSLLLDMSIFISCFACSVHLHDILGNTCLNLVYQYEGKRYEVASGIILESLFTFCLLPPYAKDNGMYRIH